MLDDAERIAAAERVFDALSQLAAFTVAHRVLIYNSLPDELSTREFISHWEDRKQFYLPRVNGLDLDILPYSRTRTHLGAFHIEDKLVNYTYSMISRTIISNVQLPV